MRRGRGWQGKLYLKTFFLKNLADRSGTWIKMQVDAYQACVGLVKSNVPVKMHNENIFIFMITETK